MWNDCCRLCSTICFHSFWLLFEQKESNEKKKNVLNLVLFRLTFFRFSFPFVWIRFCLLMHYIPMIESIYLMENDGFNFQFENIEIEMWNLIREILSKLFEFDSFPVQLCQTNLLVFDYFRTYFLLTTKKGTNKSEWIEMDHVE